MAGKIFMYFFTFLASLALISAQDDSSTTATPSDVSSPSPAVPSPPFPGFFNHLPFPFGGGAGNFHLPQLPNFPFFGGSRQKRSPQPENAAEQEQTDRLFFSLLTRQLTSCNFTTEAGSSCAACRVVRHCYPGNIGTLRTCSGLFPYCNNGRCSLYPGAKCYATTSTTTASTSTASTSTSTTTATTTTTAATG